MKTMDATAWFWHVLEIVEDALRDKTPCHIECRVRQRNGSYRYVRIQGAPMHDLNGNIGEWIGTICDIDDQKQAEEPLRLSEERHRTFSAMTALSFWTRTASGDVDAEVYGWPELTGQTADEYRSRGWLDTIHPDDKLRVLEDRQRALREGTPIDLEFRVRRKDGTYCHVRDQGVVLRNPDGSVREWVGTLEDIDQKRIAEEALRQSEDELRANFEMAAIGQVQTDPKTGRYVRVNKRFCEMTGYSEEELLTMTHLDLTHPEDRAGDMSLLLNLLRGETNKSTTDKRYVRKDGSVLWGLVSSTLIHDTRGHPLRTLTMIDDVTERKQSEALNLCQKKALEMLARGVSLDQVLNFVVLAVEKETMVDLRAAIQLLDDEGRHLRLCAAPSLPESFRQAVACCSVDSQDAPRALAVSLKEPVIVSDLADAPKWAAIANALNPYGIRAICAMPIVSSDQKPLGSLCLYSSTPRTPNAAQLAMLKRVAQTTALVIERKRADTDREDLLIREQAAREQAEAANRLKDEFLAVVSHELRAPLNAINGWAYMLLSGSMDRTAQLQALHSIQRQVHTQNQLIDDLLDVVRIASGKLRLELRDVDPAKVIAAALEVVGPAAQAKQISLVAEFDPAVKTLAADPDRLQQVIWNLLSNAIKFTPQGGRIEIRLRRTDSGVEIVVADTGQGITEDFLPYVFDRFRQADVSTTRTHGGIGLGLAIVRHLIELHGGTVFAESPGKGKGATFTIRLPVRTVQTSSPKIAARKQEAEEPRNITVENRDLLKGRRVLVVEDNPEDRDVLSAELEHQGGTVRASASAAEALIELERFRPDVLVADIGLPGEDGYSLIRKIRAYSLEEGGRTPAVALTAYAGEANRRRAFEAGYQKHMEKPADPIELAQTISQLASAWIPCRDRSQDIHQLPEPG